MTINAPLRVVRRYRRRTSHFETIERGAQSIRTKSMCVAILVHQPRSSRCFWNRICSQRGYLQHGSSIDFFALFFSFFSFFFFSLSNAHTGHCKSNHKSRAGRSSARARTRRLSRKKGSGAVFEIAMGGFFLSRCKRDIGPKSRCRARAFMSEMARVIGRAGEPPGQLAFDANQLCVVPERTKTQKDHGKVNSMSGAGGDVTVKRAHERATSNEDVPRPFAPAPYYVQPKQPFRLVFFL